MRTLAELLDTLARPNDAEARETVLARHFRSVPAEDGAWTLHLLLGGGATRLVSAPGLLKWASEAAGIAPWLAEECAGHCGDAAEAAAQLAPGSPREPVRGLASIMRALQAAAASGEPSALRETVLDVLSGLEPAGRYWLCKMVTGGFRPGVPSALLARALADMASLPPSEMTWRLSRGIEPVESAFLHLLRPETADGPGTPFAFQPGIDFDGNLESLGAPSSWHAGWRPEGVRIQILRRNSACLLWSEAGEGMNTLCPDLVTLAGRLPAGTVLEAYVLARRPGEPPACMVTDLLESAGRDLRGEPLWLRLRLLAPFADLAGLTPAPVLPFRDWNELRAQYANAEKQGADGIVLQPLHPLPGVEASPSVRLEWKTPSRALHLVLAYAQPGRAGRFSSITLGAWSGDRLVPVCKVESGLAEPEQEALDRFVLDNMVEKFGPVRSVRPEAVFRVECDGVRASTRHKSGITLRNPRVMCRLDGLSAADAETLDALQARVPLGSPSTS